MKKLNQGFHYIWIKFVNASLVNGITVNLITPSGPKCSGSKYNGFQKKHDKDSVAGKQGSREDSI